MKRISWETGWKREDAMIPNDPVMLRSYVNVKLRDFYKSLDDMCQDMELDKEELVEKLKNADFSYDPVHNQFI